MPRSLKSGLWDLAKAHFFHKTARRDIIGRIEGYTPEFDQITYTVWFHFFRRSVDERPSNPESAYIELRDFFFEKAPFYKAYEFLEFLALEQADSETENIAFALHCNVVLERERAAFRFASNILVKITNENELAEVSSAMCESEAVSVTAHVKRAAQLYSQHPNPDYRNCNKESISAVEAAVSFVIGKKTYGVAKPLRKVADIFPMHPALVDGFEKLYAFTSDAEGIRHALLDEESLSQADARYMLVSCSAFANYLISLKAEQV